MMTEQQYLPPKPTDQISTAISLDQVYPTPPPDQADLLFGQVYPQPYQPPYPQQTSWQQPYQQSDYPIPVQPADPYLQGGQNSPYQQGNFYPPGAGHPYQQQPQPHYQQQPYYQPQQQWQQPPQQMPGQQLTNSFALYLTLSILALLLFSWIFAIPAIVYATRMNTAYKQGNWPKYLKDRKTCRTWLIVSICVGIVALLYLFVIFPNLGL